MAGINHGRMMAIHRMTGSIKALSSTRAPLQLPFHSSRDRQFSSLSLLRYPNSSSSAPAASSSRTPPSNTNNVAESSTRPPSAPSELPVTPLLSPHSSPQRSSTRLQAYAPRLTALSRRTGVPFASLAGSFLVLHEITAIVPVILLFFVFQALGAGAGIVAWMSELGEEVESVISSEGEADAGVKRGGWKNRLRGWMIEAEEKAERVGKRYGVLGYDKVVKGAKSDTISAESSEPGVVDLTGKGTAEKVANAIAAYVVVKAILPLRIGLSLALAPAFARFALYPIRRLMGRIKSTPKNVP